MLRSSNPPSGRPTLPRLTSGRSFLIAIAVAALIALLVPLLMALNAPSPAAQALKEAEYDNDGLMRTPASPEYQLTLEEIRARASKARRPQDSPPQAVSGRSRRGGQPTP